MSDSRWVPIPGREYTFSDPSDSEFQTTSLRLVKNIGGGVSGQVWMVEYENPNDSATNVQGALKVYTSKLSSDERLEHQFNTETELRISDPRFVSPITYGLFTEEDERHAILFPLIPGDTLDRFVNENPDMTMRSRYAIVKELAASINLMHNIGWLHNDIKPDNVMIDFKPDSNTKPEIHIIDFQLSCKSDEISIQEVFGNVGAVVGTRGYIAPEILHGGAVQVSFSSDYWATAATAFFVLTGTEVYEHLDVENYGEDEEKFLEEMTAEPNLPIISSAEMLGYDGITPGLASTIEKCLTPIKSNRSHDAIINPLSLLGMAAKNPEASFILRCSRTNEHIDIPSLMEKYLTNHGITIDASKVIHQVYLRGKSRWINFFASIPDYPPEYFSALPFHSNLVFEDVTSTVYYMGHRPSESEKSTGVIGILDEYKEPTERIELEEIDSILSMDATPATTSLDSPPVVRSESIKINVQPQDMMQQIIMLRTGSNGVLRAAHFSGKKFENRKLVELEWDGESLFATGREYTTFEGDQLDGTLIPNGSFIEIGGIQTRITYTPVSR